MRAQVLTYGNLEWACPGKLAWGRVRGQDTFSKQKQKELMISQLSKRGSG